jgi:hypothetical protein
MPPGCIGAERRWQHHGCGLRIDESCLQCGPGIGGGDALAQPRAQRGIVALAGEDLGQGPQLGEAPVEALHRTIGVRDEDAVGCGLQRRLQLTHALVQFGTQRMLHMARPHRDQRQAFTGAARQHRDPRSDWVAAAVQGQRPGVAGNAGVRAVFGRVGLQFLPQGFVLRRAHPGQHRLAHQSGRRHARQAPGLGVGGHDDQCLAIDQPHRVLQGVDEAGPAGRGSLRGMHGSHGGCAAQPACSVPGPVTLGSKK